MDGSEARRMTLREVISEGRPAAEIEQRLILNRDLPDIINHPLGERTMPGIGDALFQLRNAPGSGESRQRPFLGKDVAVSKLRKGNPFPLRLRRQARGCLADGSERIRQ